METAIVRLRKLILSGGDPELRYANIGADALAYELRRAGITPPSRATINRILKRCDLAQPRRRKRKKRKLPDDYPWPRVEAPNDLHLFDFITRSIRGEGRFCGCNLLDQDRRWAFLRAETPKSADVVLQRQVTWDGNGWQDRETATPNANGSYRFELGNIGPAGRTYRWRIVALQGDEVVAVSPTRRGTIR